MRCVRGLLAMVRVSTEWTVRRPSVAMIHERGSGVGRDVAMKIVVVGADPSVMGAGGVRAVMWGSFVGVLGVHTCWIVAAGDVAHLWVARWPSCVWQTSGRRFYS